MNGIHALEEKNTGHKASQMVMGWMKPSKDGERKSKNGD